MTNFAWLLAMMRVVVFTGHFGYDASKSFCFFIHIFMFNTQSQKTTFFSFLESAQPLLWIPEISEFKRAEFLNEVVEPLENHKQIMVFRFAGAIDWEDLVHQITDRFFIPVRSVNVSLLRQLQDQIDILRQMKQRVVLLMDDTHMLPQQDLETLLMLAAYQKHQTTFSIVLLGKPNLEKRLMQLGHSLRGEMPEVLKLSVDSEHAGLASSLNEQVERWVLKKRVRLISVTLLILLGIFLWWFGRERRESPPQISPVLSAVPEAKSSKHPEKSELSDLLRYLKSMKHQAETEKIGSLSEELPVLPSPDSIGKVLSHD